MTAWWLLPCVLGYLAVGVAVARRAWGSPTHDHRGVGLLVVTWPLTDRALDRLGWLATIGRRR